MRHNRLRAALLLVLALALLAGALAMTSSNYRLDWLIVGASGGTSNSANYAAQVTIGQPVTGPMSGSSYKANLGYWYGLLRNFRRFLPAAMENLAH